MWMYLIIALVALIFYYLGVKPYSYWKEKNVPCIKPLPLLGNLAPIIFRQQSICEMMETLYSSHPNSRYIGVYPLLKPAFLVKDPELIKTITVKEFDSFTDHRVLVPEEVDSLWNKNLFSLRGEKWHNMRGYLSPSFTSSKMKMMYFLINDCAREFIGYLQNKNGIVEIEIKDAFRKFTNDVIATTAFGVQCNSLKEANNEFFLMGKEASNFDGLKALKAFLFNLSPRLLKVLDIGMIPKKVSNYFRNVIKETIEIRLEKGIVRLDMIHLLLEARKGQQKKEDLTKTVDSGFAVAYESDVINRVAKDIKDEITDEDIVAHAFLFFAAGFETSSTFLSFTAYELAVNPDVQETLFGEIEKYYNKCDGNISYEALLEMRYLDMVVSESLRKWPPVAAADRLSVKEFTIDAKLPEEKDVILEVGTNVWIPIYAIHRDPNYYPDPDKFDPERFNDDNKHAINSFTYMPFGLGPRNCIGSRFALLEGKLILTKLLHKFEIVPIEKTQIPLRLKKGSVVPVTEKGIWLGLKPRNIK